MSVNLNILISRIPQDKLAEIVNSFTSDTTTQQILDSLSAAGVEASEEEAQALMTSLLLYDDEGRELSETQLDAVAGGEEDVPDYWHRIVFPDGSVRWVRYTCPNCKM